MNKYKLSAGKKFLLIVVAAGIAFQIYWIASPEAPYLITWVSLNIVLAGLLAIFFLCKKC